MKNELPTKIYKWIKKEGYPLEMSVASALLKNEFDVTQSSFFIDRDTGASREIDVIASSWDPVGILHIDFVIECKKTSKPVIFFTSNNASSGYNRLFVTALINSRARKALIDAEKDTTKRFVEHSWVPMLERSAYGSTQAFSSGKDMCYEASIKVLKASFARQKQIFERHSPSILSFIFPVIVYDADLFECYLDEDGEIVVNEIEYTNLLMPMEFEGDLCPFIRVVSAKTIDERVKDCVGLVQDIKKMLHVQYDIVKKEVFKQI